MKKFRGIDLTGKRFGCLVVWKMSHYDTVEKRRHWICLCDCGGRQTLETRNLTRYPNRKCVHTLESLPLPLDLPQEVQ
jgi:hypothetical protein